MHTSRKKSPNVEKRQLKPRYVLQTEESGCRIERATMGSNQAVMFMIVHGQSRSQGPMVVGDAHGCAYRWTLWLHRVRETHSFPWCEKSRPGTLGDELIPHGCSFGSCLWVSGWDSSDDIGDVGRVGYCTEKWTSPDSLQSD